MIARVLTAFGLENPHSVTQLTDSEDGSAYRVWRVNRAGEQYILKLAKAKEAANYAQYFSEPCPSVPKLLATARVDGEDYLLLEFIPGHDLMRAEREDLRLVLDALIQLQRRFCHSEDPLRSFEASLEGRKNRRNYLRENCLERVYDAYLQAYLRMFRTLCHDDLLPFNVLVCDQRAVMIDWEHAGILPYPTSVARLIAHGEEDENAFFYLKSSDKQFVIDYYYDNFVKEMGISRDEYDWHMNLCLFYEYCEWVYVGNRYGNTNSQRFLHYTQKAMQMAEVLSEKI